MIESVIADYADFMPVVLVLLLDLIFEHASEREKVQEQEKERNQTCHIARAAEDFRASRHRNARVVEWQTRTFEGRMPKGMRVQVPPRALKIFPLAQTSPSRRR
jgi:hypothetical protein